jgi:hypothetical protein
MILNQARSYGLITLMVKAEDSWLSGCEFKPQRCILEGESKSLLFHLKKYFGNKLFLNIPCNKTEEKS